MTQIPAGWYPDPDPDAPEPRGRRYWDGRMWTEHVQPPPGAPTYPPAPAYGASSPGTPSAPEAGRIGYPQGSSGHPGAPYAGAAGLPATTPDGQPLATWWSRVGAYVLDLLIVTPVILLLASPWLGDLFRAFGDFLDEATRAAESGQTPPDQAALTRDIAGPMLAVNVVILVVISVYNVAFLKWRAATPGKLIVGLRVRLRETPGPLGWGTIVKRWLGQFGCLLVWVLPVIGSIAPVYFVLDSLWPLWDPKKQAVHDKVAATNVVRVR